MMTYLVRYMMYDRDEVRWVCLAARNKNDAYDKAVYEVIPKKEHSLPYAAWVHSVTYSNGNERKFNTCCGCPV